MGLGGDVGFARPKLREYRRLPYGPYRVRGPNAKLRGRDEPQVEGPAIELAVGKAPDPVRSRKLNPPPWHVLYFSFLGVLNRTRARLPVSRERDRT